MLRVSLKGILARKLRLLLTSIAIVLGVGFVAGAFFLTDSMRGSFETIFEDAYASVDVEVQSTAYDAFSTAAEEGSLVPVDLAQVGISPETVDQIRGVDGVRMAEGGIFEMGAQALGKDGKPIGSFGAPSFAANWSDEAEFMGALKIDEGSAPRRGSVLLDAAAFERGELKVGDEIDVLFQGGRTRETFTVAGSVTFGGRSSLNGASILVFDATQLQELLETDGNFSTVAVIGDGDIEPEELQRAIDAELGEDFKVATGSQIALEETESIDSSFLNILQNVILAFAAIAVFVGAFTIFNTFTILIGQRTREFGLLRMLGARRHQVLGIVTLEALVIGIIASTIGIAAGYGIAVVLRELLNTFGFEIPSTAFPLRARTVIASYGVGVLVTLIASVVPAWRAARLSPLDAIRSSGGPQGRGWRAPTAGAVLLVIGSLLIVRGLNPAEGASTSSTLISIGIGFLVAIVGLSMLSRLFIAPVTRVLGAVLGRGQTGRIAVGNVLRNRARAATTSSALMIGLALASLVLVFYASLQATVDDQVDRAVGADISIYNSSFGGTTPTVDDATVELIRGVDGVDFVGTQRLGSAMVGDTFDLENGELTTVAAFSEGAVGTGQELARIELTGGESTPGDGVLVDDQFAKNNDLSVGDELELVFPNVAARTFEVRGIYERSQIIGTPIMLSLETFDAVQPPALRAASFVMATIEDGVTSSTVVKRIEQAIGTSSEFIEVLDTEGIKQQARDQLAPVVSLVFAMLSLSIVIALFGIGNTLALNVFERTREIGLMRAVGGTRRQLRRIIRVEAVLVALFGAIVGVAVGIAAGATIISALRDDGFVFAISAPAIIGVLIGGFVAGVLASVLPARRAARTDVLEAIANE